MTPELALEHSRLVRQVGTHAGQIVALKDGHKALQEAVIRISEDLNAFKMWLLGAVFAAALLASSAVGTLVLVVLKKQ